MSIINKILQKRGYLKENDLSQKGYIKTETHEAAIHNIAQRAYEAALRDRFTSNTLFTDAKIDADIKAGLVPVRTRARNTFENDDYAAAYIKRCIANIPGAEGFTLQMRIKNSKGENDTEANQLIEDKFTEWCKKEFCTMQGRLNFLRVQWVETFHLKLDGELLLRMVYGPNTNKFGFALDILEPEDLDESYNAVLRSGNIVKMGVEYNSWRRPVAYWLKDYDLEHYLNNSKSYQRIRVDAQDIIFDFDQNFAKQTRAVSPLAPTLKRLNGIQGWERASLINAEGSAKSIGLFSRKSKEGQEIEEDDTDENGNPVLEFKNGQIRELPFDSTLMTFDPKFPTEQHPFFLKSQLRAVAGALGLSYNSFASDLEGVNFSSMRSGLNDERDNWQVGQSLLKESLCIPVFTNWLKWSLMHNALLPYTYFDYERLNKPEFYGRIWPWVDPEADINAAIKEIQWGLNSRTRINRRRGIDNVDIFTELKQEAKDSEGINITGQTKETKTETKSTEDNTVNDDEDTKNGGGTKAKIYPLAKEN